MKRTRLCLLLLVASCSSIPVRAKHDIIGISRSSLIACAGVPDNTAILDDGEVLQWRQDQAVQGPFTVKGPFGLEVDLSGHGTCHVVARLHEGRVAQVEYTGPSSTLLGPYSACRPLVAACEQLVSRD
ncbi:hypothetical protein PY793_04245 [Acetobacter fabarum]|uniref:hypothetical protein n=1 Tax=Acetobacter fabarum TaxID=483199 RepID=UPI00312B5B2A